MPANEALNEIAQRNEIAWARVSEIERKSIELMLQGFSREAHDMFRIGVFAGFHPKEMMREIRPKIGKRTNIRSVERAMDALGAEFNRKRKAGLCICGEAHQERS